MRHKFDRWQVLLTGVIMLMLVVMLGMSLGGAAYAWSPPAGENVVLDNARSVRGKDMVGTEQNLLTLYSNTCLNTPAGKAILFTVDNAEKARLTYTGSMVLPNGVSYSAKNAGGTVQNLLTLYSNTCLNAPSGKDILFTVNNGERARLTSTGNVGIGDTTPTEGRLVVQTTSGVAVYGKGSGPAGYLGTDTSGVFGYAVDPNDKGVYGNSSNGIAVDGFSSNVTGVKGEGGDKGVYGVSGSGSAIYGYVTGTGYAGYFDGRVKVDGSLAMAYRLSGTNTAVDEDDSIVAVNASVAPLTVTLPTAVGITGRTYTIKRVNASNNVTIDPDGSQTIDGATTYTLSAQWDFITIISDGTNWLIVANN